MKPATNRNPGPVRARPLPSTNLLWCSLQTRNLFIINPRGLHARACARIVDISSRFRSNVSLVIKGRRASARNIVAVMLLTASVGTTVRVEIEGPDEEEAMREITALFHDGFGERS
jgi:phosphocarrier protein HPr